MQVPENALEEDAPEEEEWRVQAERFKDEGNEAFRRGAWQQAVDLYGRAIDLNPEDRVYYSNRSAAYLKQGDAKSRALKDAERCVELGRDWPKAYSRLGAAQHALGRLEAAIETYRAGLALEAENANLKEGLASAERALEVQKKERCAEAQREREEEERKQKARDEEKQKAEEKAAAESAQEDPLADFFADITKAADEANGIKKEDKTMNEKYVNQDLGSPQEQISRLLCSNYKWKNLNPYVVLALDVDATVEDIKMRYRKLSTMVHPDKRRDVENARDAFEEVKKAYQALMDESRRKTVVETVEVVRKRVAKERAKLVSKGMSAAQLLERHGTEEAHSKREVMKEFGAIELRRREIEEHQNAMKKRERDQQDQSQNEIKRVHAREQVWNEEEGRERRVGNWRDFASAKAAGPKKTRTWKEEGPSRKQGAGNGTRELHDKVYYKKDWK